MKGQRLDLIGQRFGRLTVLSRSAERQGSFVCWECRCECGIELVVSGNALRSKQKESCGCLYMDSRKRAGTKGLIAGQADRVRRSRRNLHNKFLARNLLKRLGL